MPFYVRKKNNKFLIMRKNSDDSFTKVGESDSLRKAKASIRARYSGMKFEEYLNKRL